VHAQKPKVMCVKRESALFMGSLAGAHHSERDRIKLDDLVILQRFLRDAAAAKIHPRCHLTTMSVSPDSA
jgi:hypothetical protein